MNSILITVFWQGGSKQGNYKPEAHKELYQFWAEHPGYFLSPLKLWQAIAIETGRPVDELSIWTTGFFAGEYPPHVKEIAL